MPILAIETSSRQLGVSVMEGDRLLSSYEVLADYPHAVELPDGVRRVLKTAKITLAHLEAIAVDIGPGSFTGLRIGLSFAKGLAYPHSKPFVSIPSLDVLAAQLPYAQRLICPLLDARQSNVYAACYRFEQGRPVRQTDFYLGPPEAFLKNINEPAVFVGDGCAPYGELIKRLCPQSEIASSDWWIPRSATLARLGGIALREGRQEDPANVIPLYLYPLDCSVRGPNRPTAVLPRQALSPRV